MNIKKRVWEITEASKDGDRLSTFFDGFILSLIFLNVIAVIVGTIPELDKNFETFLSWFEVFSVGTFSIEYLARIWSSVSDDRYKHPILGRIKFAGSPLSLIDLLAIAPFYLAIIGLDLRFMRIVRLLRIFRVVKLVKYIKALSLFGRVLKKKKEEIIITTMIMILFVILASSFMYYAENQAQPENFSSIPAAMWWAIATLTTVGYGDVYPITTTGKFLAGIIAVLGIGFFALPAGILGSGFVDEIQNKSPEKQTCPHCGKELV